MAYQPTEIHVPLITRTFAVRESDVRRAKIVPTSNSRLATLGIACWIALLNDSPVPSLDVGRRLVTVSRFYKNVLARPLRETVKVYSSIADDLIANLVIGENGTTTGPFDNRFKDTPVFKEYLNFRRTRDARLLRFLINFLWFLKKLKIKDPELNATAMSGWLACEDHLANINPDEGDLRAMRLILTALLPDPDIQDFWPKHGPGSVAQKGVKTLVEKGLKLTFHTKIHELFFRHKQLPISSFIPDEEVWEEERTLSLSDKQISGEARLEFVFKDVTKSRSICMEPAIVMYFQQGVMRMLLRAINSSSFGAFVNIADQAANRELARLGSIMHSHDTLDLSSASDLVSWKVVKSIFPAKWLVYFAATRTTSVDTGTGSVKVLKYAPMGSALCFPVESLVFCTAVLLVKLREIGVDFSSASHADIRRSIRAFLADPCYGTNEEVRVYGDDIIVDSKISNDVITLLHSLGLKVNTSKSFSGAQCFRESCGGFYYEGKNVTPVLFKVKPFGKNGGWNAGTYTSAIAHANNYGDRGMPSVRKVLIHSLWDIPTESGDKVVVPFVSDRRRFGIYTTRQNTNPGRKVKLDRYQYKTVKALCVEAPVELEGTDLTKYEDWIYSHYGYLQYWGLRGSDNVDGDSLWSPLLPLRGAASLVWAWTPIE